MERTAVPAAYSQERPSDPQLKFIRGLMRERDLDKLRADQRDWLLTEMQKSEDDQLLGVPVKRASDIITQLLKLPLLASVVEKQNREKPNVPPGRYAVESDEGELRFYRVWIGNTGFAKVYVLHGPDSSEVPFKSAMGILRKIEQAGIEAAAIRFGNEIGACSNCGRRLTNRISRELGIGPVCGGRMFGDMFGTRVLNARREILKRGEDPDEVIDER